MSSNEPMQVEKGQARAFASPVSGEKNGAQNWLSSMSSAGDAGIRRTLITGYSIVALLLGGVGGWAATSELAGAVLAGGTVVVESNLKKVQHAVGGVVGLINVKDGDRVQEGDLLVRLDETITRANLQVIVKQLDELSMRRARLSAERDELTEVEIPERLLTRLGDRTVNQIVAGERSLFESRRFARAGQKNMLLERIAQLREETNGLEAQLKSKARQVELVKSELASVQGLWSKNLVSLQRYMQMEREAVRLEGEHAQLISTIAQSRGRVAEIRLQILQIDQDLRSEVIRDMREMEAKEGELVERQVAAEDVLKRIEIRAPFSGVVHQLAVHTVGGVVTASEPLMLIVPDGEERVLEAKIAPQDINNVRPGQVTVVRFTAFNAQTTPELNGTVARVSADLLREPQTGMTYYAARIALSKEELARLGDKVLIPGMPAEVHIRTADRTPLSYLLKPLTDQLARAFRES